jgi:hypothetical protein
MKASELRIGNFIYKESEYEFENGINQIISVLQFECVSTRPLNCHVKHYNVNTSNLKPIPLTEEWLLKFGFEKTEWDNFNSYRLMIGSNDYAIILYSDGNCEVGDIITCKIEYVHQLQNLYFALTGEELTLKP